jgi:Mn-dependent DtxR family transcriptional regulator
LLERHQQLSNVGQPIEVTIKYGTLEKKITGPPEQVAKEVFSFLTKTIPELELASHLALSVDLNELAKACEGVLAVTPEGVVATIPLDNLADRELILFHLAKARIAQMLGKSEKDFVQSADLIAATKRTSGTVAGRLSELCAENLTERKGKGEYRATTLGLHIFREQVLPKLKTKP